jgi:hypothetical protein
MGTPIFGVAFASCLKRQYLGGVHENTANYEWHFKIF